MMFDKRCRNCKELLPYNCTVCPACGYNNINTGAADGILPEGSELAGRYTVIGALRRTVYELRYIAYDKNEQRNVYIDEFFPASAASRGGGEKQLLIAADEKAAMEAAIQEACTMGRRACRAGKISGFASVLDVFEENGTVYTVLEQIDGAEMGRKNLGKAEPEAIRSLLGKLASTLIQMHRKGIYHASLSPDYIFIDRDGQPVIMGLGVAAAEFRRNSLREKETDDFAAPEAQSGLYGKLGIEADIYSLAALAAAMACGKAPEAVSGKNPRVQLRGLSKSQQSCIARALSMDAMQRQRSVESFYEQFLGQPSVTKTQPCKKAKRDTKSLLVAIAGAVLIIAGLLLLILPVGLEETEIPADEGSVSETVTPELIENLIPEAEEGSAPEADGSTSEYPETPADEAGGEEMSENIPESPMDKNENEVPESGEDSDNASTVIKNGAES